MTHGLREAVVRRAGGSEAAPWRAPGLTPRAILDKFATLQMLADPAFATAPCSADLCRP